MEAFDILRRPIVTEKSTIMHEGGRYTFEVATSATKLQIKWAVERAFPDVNVVKVNTLNMRGKVKRFGGRVHRKPSWKKAFVTLAAGQSITIFEGV